MSKRTLTPAEIGENSKHPQVSQKLRQDQLAGAAASARPELFGFSKRRRVEFLGFMNSVVAAFPGRELHVILDNLKTQKKNQRWLKKRPNVHFYFTPTRSSWRNQIETWFSILQG